MTRRLNDENADANPNVGTEDDDRAEKWIEGKVVDVDKDDADNPLPYSVEFDDGTFEDLAHEELEVWVQARIKHQKTEERRAWEEEMERKRSEREAERKPNSRIRSRRLRRRLRRRRPSSSPR